MVLLDSLRRLHGGSAGCFLRTYFLWRLTGRWDDTIGASKLLDLQFFWIARVLNLAARSATVHKNYDQLLMAKMGGFIE